MFELLLFLSLGLATTAFAVGIVMSWKKNTQKARRVAVGLLVVLAGLTALTPSANAVGKGGGERSETLEDFPRSTLEEMVGGPMGMTKTSYTDFYDNRGRHTFTQVNIPCFDPPFAAIAHIKAADATRKKYKGVKIWAGTPDQAYTYFQPGEKGAAADYMAVMLTITLPDKMSAGQADRLMSYFYAEFAKTSQQCAYNGHYGQ